jgi:iron-sulfur cluster assembly protein
MSITLTEPAAAEVKRLMESQKLEEGSILRVAISGGGCQGLQYGLGFDTNFDPAEDSRFEQHGVPVVTKKKMALFLDGTTIDFKDGPAGRGFAIENPNVSQGGGCPGCGGH